MQQPKIKMTGFGPGEELDLGSPKTLQQLQEYASYLVVNDYDQDAYELSEKLDLGMQYRNDLFQHPSSISAAYDQLFGLVRGVAISMMSEVKLKAYFQKGIAYALRNPDIDVVDKVSSKMAKLMFLEERDDLKKKLRFELRQNYERLTYRPLRSSIGDVAPTVKEWLKIAELQGEQSEPLTVRILENQQFTQLATNEQEIVGRLLALDDYLSIPSDSAVGFENPISFVDDQGQHFIMKNGAIGPAYDESDKQIVKQTLDATGVKSSRTAEEVATALREADTGSTADEERYDDQEKLIQLAGSDTGKVIDVLATGVAEQHPDAIIAPLFVLARYGALESAMKDDRIRTSFEDHFIAELAKQAGVPTDVAFAITAQNFGKPATIAAFMHWSLQLSTSDDAESARLGNKIGNIVAALGRPEFVRMTYFDMKSGTYHWTPVTLKQDGTLAWAG